MGGVEENYWVPILWEFKLCVCWELNPGLCAWLHHLSHTHKNLNSSESNSHLCAHCWSCNNNKCMTLLERVGNGFYVLNVWMSALRTSEGASEKYRCPGSDPRISNSFVSEWSPCIRTF